MIHAIDANIALDPHNTVSNQDPLLRVRIGFEDALYLEF